MGELDGVKAAMMARAATALEAIGNDLLGEAQRQAPVEEGTLRGSGSVELRQVGNSLEVEVSFNTPYAARQHEETEWRHPLGGKAKYLEDPLKGRAAAYERILGAAVGRGL